MQKFKMMGEQEIEIVLTLDQILAACSDLAGNAKVCFIHNGKAVGLQWLDNRHDRIILQHNDYSSNHYLIINNLHSHRIVGCGGLRVFTMTDDRECPVLSVMVKENNLILLAIK